MQLGLLLSCCRDGPWSTNIGYITPYCIVIVDCGTLRLVVSTMQSCPELLLDDYCSNSWIGDGATLLLCRPFLASCMALMDSFFWTGFNALCLFWLKFRLLGPTGLSDAEYATVYFPLRCRGKSKNLTCFSYLSTTYLFDSSESKP
jgi:hypothetical protein